MQINNFFNDKDDVFLEVDSNKVENLSKPQKITKSIIEAKYEPITKYTFYDHNDNWAK